MATWARRAIVVVHGIGVQQRAATLNAFVRGLRRHGGAEGGELLQETVPFGCDLPPDAIRLRRGGVSADVYEVYWAPHTSRKTTARAVLSWLLRTTFLPGDRIARPSRKTIFDLAVGLVGIGAAAFLVLVGITSLGNLSSQVACRTDREVVCTVPEAQRELSGPEVTAESFGQVSAAFGAIRNSLVFTDRPLSDFTPDHAADVLTRVNLQSWLILMLVAFFTAQLLFRLLQVARALTAGLRAARERYRVGIQLAMCVGWAFALGTAMQAVPPVLVAFIWVIVATSLVIRATSHFLAETLGDVHVYSDRDENSEHFAAREAVLAEAERVFEVIEARGYEQVVVFGHSLGSVVAFSALDRLVRRNPALLGTVETFVTFGSALEKVRYFFERKADADAAASARLDSSAVAISAGRAWLNILYENDLVANAITTFQGGRRPRTYKWRSAPPLADMLEESRRELVVNVSFGWPLFPFPLWSHSRYLADPVILRLMGDIALPPLTTPSGPPGTQPRNLPAGA